MALSLSPSLRLKATAGQASPINEVGAHEVLSGGTFSLVDRGSGDVAWQMSGTGDTRAVIGSAFDLNQTTGGTFAVTLRIVTAPTVDFTKYVSYTNAAIATGVNLTQNGAGNIRARTTDNGSLNVTTSIGAAGLGVDVTYVVRVGASHDIWTTVASRVGTSPNATSSMGAFTTATLTDLVIHAGATDVIQVKDIAFFQGKLTDTECAALADNFRATIDASAGTSVSSDLTATYSISSAVTQVSSDLAASYSVAAHVSASLAASYSVAGTPASGSFVTDAWINNTGTPRGAIAVSYTWVGLGRIGSLASKTLTEGTATLSAGSILTVTGLPVGAGFMLGAVLGADATTDDVYYEAGTAA